MAITFSQEIGDGKRIYTFSDKRVRSYVRSFKVRSDSMTVGQLEISTAPGLPALYASYSDRNGTFYDLGAILRSFTIRETEDPFTWIIDCNYSSPEPKGNNTSQGGQQGQTAEQNPLTRPPEWRMNFGAYQKPIDKDFSSPPKPIVTSATQRFDPAVTTDDIRPTLVISKNFASFDPEVFSLFRNCVNNTDISISLPNLVTTLDAGFWKLVQLDGENANESGIFYSKITIGLAGNPDGWNPDDNVLDHGTQILVSGKRVPAYRNGAPTGDTLLDGSGNLLPDGGTPAYLTYQLNPEADLNLLGHSFFVWP